MRKQMKPKRERLNMRVPADLLDWAKGYVSLKNTTVTQLFVDHLTHLKEHHGRKNGIERRARPTARV